MIAKVGQSFSNVGLALKRVCGLGPPIPKEVLHRALFGKGPFIPKSAPLVSGIGMGSVSMVGDYTSFSRALEDFAIELGMANFFSTKDMLVSYQTFGTVTGINLIIGLIHVFHAYSGKKTSDVLGDQSGSLIGRVSILGGGALASGGACFAAFRTLAIYNAVNDIKPASLLGRMTHSFAMVGMAFFSLFFALLTVVFGVKLHEGLKLKNKMEEASDIADKAALLQKKYGAESGRVLEKLIAKTGSSVAAQKLLIQEAEATGKAHLKALMKELKLPSIDDEKCAEIVREAVKAQVGLFGSLEGKLGALGLEMMTQKTQMKKDEKLSRVLSSSGIEALKELKSSKATQELIKVIQASNNGKIKEYAIVIAVLLLGIVTLSSAILFSGGILASIFVIIFSIAMTGIDGYYLMQSYNEETPAKHDKKLLALSSVLALTSLVSMLALGFTGVVTFGIVPIVITAVLAAIWLGQNGVSLWVMNRNEQRALIKNPTFEGLLKALDGGKGELAELMLKNLTEEQRKLLEKEMKAHSGQMKEALRSVISKVDLARKAHLEHLRGSIAKLSVA